MAANRHKPRYTALATGLRLARQRGAALLMAMLTVTLVATLAAAAMWQQFRQVEIESAERTRIQTAWLLTGALDWARLILREDARGSTADDLSEPWAVPLAEARLSTFLAAADKDAATDLGDEATEIFLSGQIEDLQGRLNISNLVDGATVSAKGVQSFQRLFTLLGLPIAEVPIAAQRLRDALDPSVDKPELQMAPLPPQRVRELAWLGFSVPTLARIEPFIAVLPGRTPINLNTASAEVIHASLPKVDMATAQAIVQRRTNKPFKRTDEVKALVGPDVALDEGDVGVATSYFAIRGRLRTSRTIIEEWSLARRVLLDVTIVRRERLQPTLVQSLRGGDARAPTALTPPQTGVGG